MAEYGAALVGRRRERERRGLVPRAGLEGAVDGDRSDVRVASDLVVARARNEEREADPATVVVSAELLVSGHATMEPRSSRLGKRPVNIAAPLTDTRTMRWFRAQRRRRRMSRSAPALLAALVVAALYLGPVWIAIVATTASLQAGGVALIAWAIATLFAIAFGRRLGRRPAVVPLIPSSLWVVLPWLGSLEGTVKAFVLDLVRGAGWWLCLWALPWPWHGAAAQSS